MKNAVYKTGDFIQKIIIKNIVLFITLGFIKWIIPYRPELSMLENIFTSYIIPLSIGYTTGNMIDKKHGGQGGIIGTGLIVCTNAAGNLLEVIAISAVVSWTIKIFKEKVLIKAMPGFEMFIINMFVPAVSIGYYFLFAEIIRYTNAVFEAGIELLLNVKNDIFGIVILTMLIQISKIFFINNFVNHGILALAGYKEVMEKGDSLFFLLETNPRPGLGILLAIYFFTKEKKNNITANIIVEFFGGIHEMYFPYVLKNLKLIGALIIGGVAGDLFFYMFKVTLSSMPSPGSVIMITMLAASSRFYLLSGIFISALFSFGAAYVILSMKNEKPVEVINEKKEKTKISIVCNGGMGSSHIGKTFLQNVINEKKLENIEVNSTFIGDEIKNSDFIITHNNFKEKAKEMYPESFVIGLENYMDKEFYSQFAEQYLLNCFKDDRIEKEEESKTAENEIKLGLKSVYEENAVEFMEKETGCLKENIIFSGNGMIFLGKTDSRTASKITVHQYPYGIKDDEDKNNFLVVGVCADSEDNYKKILSSLKKISDSQEIVSELEISDDEKYFAEIFNLENLLKTEEKNAE